MTRSSSRRRALEQVQQVQMAARNALSVQGNRRVTNRAVPPTGRHRFDSTERPAPATSTSSGAEHMAIIRRLSHRRHQKSARPTCCAVFSQSSIGGDAQVSVGEPRGTYLQFARGRRPREVTQYAQPGGSGFAAQVHQHGRQRRHLLSPDSRDSVPMPTGSVILPSAPWDGQRVNVHCVAGHDGLLCHWSRKHPRRTHDAGCVSGFFTMRWDAATSGWWRAA
jgi:hypothetical protein